MPDRRSVIKKAAISAFALLNLATVLYSNRPDWATAAVNRVIETTLSPRRAYRVHYAGWLVSRYAHLTGLDNRWQMFSTQSRFNWWYGIQAVAVDGNALDLSLPLQGARTFAERVFFDFREAKYHLNLYGSADLRYRYARYLCGAFSLVEGRNTAAVRFVLHHQKVFDRRTARALGEHLEPHSHSRLLSEFPCPQGW